jgi:predicted acyltransferase
VAYLEWPRKLADGLARVLGIVLVLEGIGIFSVYCCEFDVWVASFLLFAGLESIMLPDTDFWKQQFRKGEKRRGKKK